MTELTISLVVCTLGREAELSRCIDSLIQQDYPKLEVVIVDQSGDDRLLAYIERLQAACHVRHLRVGRMGASAARNFGAKYATGDVLSFPDDDCWYTPGVLALVNELLNSRPFVDGITGRTVAEDGRPGNGRFGTTADWVQKRNAWTTSIEFTIFVHRRLWEAVGGFDENFGTGASTPFQAGEGTDYMIRAIGRGFRVWYTPDLTIGHARPLAHRNISGKAYRYGIGMGYVARRHRLPLGQTSALLIRPLLGVGVSLVLGRLRQARYHAVVCLGRSMGFFRGNSLADVSSKAGRLR